MSSAPNLGNRYARRPRPELRTRGGELILSHNHIALLQALLDRPRATAQSTADWARAAVPYVRTFRDPCVATLEAATRRVHPLWVKHRRKGNRNTWKLTRRGRAILELQVPVYIKGYGWYHGLSAFRGFTPATTPRRKRVQFDCHEWSSRGWESVEDWWAAIQTVRMHRGIVHFINALVDRWSQRVEINAELYEGGFLPVMADQVRRYICWFVMKHRCFPAGTHEIPMAPGVDTYGFEVDFDDIDQ